MHVIGLKKFTRLYVLMNGFNDGINLKLTENYDVKEKQQFFFFCTSGINLLLKINKLAIRKKYQSFIIQVQDFYEVTYIEVRNEYLLQCPMLACHTAVFNNRSTISSFSFTLITLITSCLYMTLFTYVKNKHLQQIFSKLSLE